MVFCNVVDSIFDCPLTCHNPYFNRWFSAILLQNYMLKSKDCHNPYFNRWFSAINDFMNNKIVYDVTILILIDGFLQLIKNSGLLIHHQVSQSLF